MINFLLVFVGAGIGGVLRYGTGIMVVRLTGLAAFWSTAMINIVGSFFIGVLLALFTTRSGDWSSWQLLCVTGLLGGFTTFSAFSAETVNLFREGQALTASLYILVSVGMSLGAFWLGDFIAKITGITG